MRFIVNKKRSFKMMCKSMLEATMIKGHDGSIDYHYHMEQVSKALEKLNRSEIDSLHYVMETIRIQVNNK